MSPGEKFAGHRRRYGNAENLGPRRVHNRTRDTKKDQLIILQKLSTNDLRMRRKMRKIFKSICGRDFTRQPFRLRYPRFLRKRREIYWRCAK